MKKIYIVHISLICVAFLLIFSCKKKDYILGGTTEAQVYKNTLTYDVLKGNPLYDTLIMLIDSAGIEAQVNQMNSTFFAPSDYSIYNYLESRTLADQLVNPYAQFGLDSLIYYVKNNINGTKDSLLMYFVDQPLPFTVLSSDGAAYPTALSGDTAVVSYEYTKNTNLGYNSIVSSVPQVVYYTQLWYHYSVSPSTPADSITAQIGARTLCVTSGIATQNGYLNALDNSHVLFFYGTKQ